MNEREIRMHSALNDLLYLLQHFDSIKYTLMSVLAFRRHCWNCSNVINNFWRLLNLTHVGSSRFEIFLGLINFPCYNLGVGNCRNFKVNYQSCRFMRLHFSKFHKVSHISRKVYAYQKEDDLDIFSRFHSVVFVLQTNWTLSRILESPNI